ncbi:MAG: PqqD family protein [Alistipes sp.]
MKIKEEFKVREIAGEHVVIMQGRYGVDMTKVIALNDSSLYLWNELQGREFDTIDVVDLLLQHYHIGAEIAEHDAEAWVAKLNECNLI